MAIDFKIISVSDGFYDVSIPIETVQNDDLFFQQVELLLNTYLGDWVYDIAQGIEYSLITKRKIDYKKIENEFYNKISVLVNFGNFEDFEIKIDENRQVHISMKLTSISGNTEILGLTL